MSIKADHWIRKMAREQGMIEPFVEGQVRDGVISYGLSSYGYDMRVSDEFKVFTNVFNVIVDPKNFSPRSFVDIKADYCDIPPNSFALARSVEYFRIPRSTTCIVLGKSTYARCFRGDTRVALVDGTSVALEDMARRAENGELFWGYSVGPHGRIIVTLLDQPRYIGRDALLEIELDNGATIHCTPDHEFMLRDGQMRAAGELSAGISLMPLYRDVFRGYEGVFQPLTGTYTPTHRLADEWNIRNGIEHLQKGQGERASRFWTDPHYEAIRQQLRQKHREYWSVEQQRDAQRQRQLAYWDDETRRAERSEFSEDVWSCDDGTRRAKQQELARALRIRTELTDEAVKAALQETGSIRGTTRFLNCDRSVFRRFPDAIKDLRGNKTNHRITAIRSLAGDHDVYCLTVPETGNFALEAGVFVSNCGIIVNITPLEPEWEGFVTIEISNTTPLPARIYANEGIGQVLFLESDAPCEQSYRDKKGKYQSQVGIVLPRIDGEQR